MILTGLGGGTPGGSTTQIQYNNAGVFGGDSALVWNSTTDQVISGSLSDINANILAYATEGPSVVGIGRAKGFGYSVGALGISSSSTEDAYGVESIASVSVSGLTAIGTEAAGVAQAVGASAVGIRAFANANAYGGAAFNANVLYSIYAYAPAAYGNATATVGYHLWMEGGAIANVANVYFIWADSLGVYRIREDAIADGASFPQAIPALYNPRFTKYVPGAANFERGVQQWVSNVYQMGAEAGGTGTLRAIKIIGASLDVPATFTVGGLPISSTPGGSTTQLQYNNAGAFGGITGATTNGTTLTLVAPVLGSATATSISVGLNTPGFTQQRPNANTSQILIQSTVPPEGRTNEAPFMWLQGGATFGSDWDPVMYFGYNADRTVATEPAMRWVIEGNYLNTNRYIESYWEYVDTAALGSGVWRPFFITAQKGVTTNKTIQINGGIVLTDVTSVAGAGIVNLKLAPTGANARAILSMSNGVGNNGTNQTVDIYGGNAENTGAWVRISGNTSTNAPYWTIGSLLLNAGTIAAPTAGSTQGAIVLSSGTTYPQTERLRVQPDGNIAVAKVGVAATALMHLGPGTATASTAPLKFTSGTLNTTAEAGAVEFLTDAYYGTITTGAARKTFAFLEGPTLTAPVTITGAVGSSALTINSATQTASFPVINASQTWNNAAVVFTGLTQNITDTASNSTSRIFDFKRNGSSVFYHVASSGATYAPYFVGSTGMGMESDSGNFYVGSSSVVRFYREASYTLAIRNGTNAMTSRLYNTFTDASNYERLGFTWASNIARIGTANAGTGTARVLNLDYGGTTTAAISIPITSGVVTFGGGITTPGGAALHTTNTALNDGAAAALGTLSNAPTAGNPTKWIPINDNGTTRYIPAW